MEKLNKRILGVIPARFASSRFEGKPLALIGDTEMIVCVCKRVEESGLFDKVIVATDSRRIFDVVQKNNFTAVMTSENHACGTDRVEEAFNIAKERFGEFDIIVNIQGDEPLIRKEQLEEVISPFIDEDVQISTLCKMIEETQTLTNPNVVKVVFDNNNNALYFSRSVIPYNRNETFEYGIAKGIYFKHIGLYAFRKDVLSKIVKLYLSRLEKVESLEQLRWLEEGYKIRVSVTEFESIGVDTPEDLEKINNILNTI
ncbi:MAG: 3-deoxy-manno-octulosonate cytidylyltransferase [Bacteroidales bacterium]|jgi:3-deoxy-manno-octulosonate cytidylyltransferase (CMP-KDO synthetase)|nr:3-deoxy-manno-octulosonate cytidylyltransferase [Bacteroidales bacterium]MDD4704027.1 3-deoxy-manno-octulosonate cytidylyltransferase [Bacteroidales bacterium]MDX9797511.1 3-deoxy-manno-octulosonate cytidylyltransferase [Bacteroidales bacterium]